jgi:hypothetical protein
MNDTELENELRALRPVRPSPELRDRIADALEPRAMIAVPPVLTPSFFSRWLERFFWAGAGAAACAMVFITMGPRQPAVPVAMHDTQSKPSLQAPLPHVSEEPLAWTDEGVQFIGNGIPARLLRRVSLERHLSDDGIEVQVPREDVIVVPLAVN